MTQALAIVVVLSLSPQAPDLQIEASTSAGAPLPELTDAVARALVASGSRVVLRSPTSPPCAYCATITILETHPGDYRLAISQGNHAASATLHINPSSPLFDRARAIAVQTRLLITWNSAPEPQAKATPLRPRDRRRALRAADGHTAETAKAPAHALLPSPASSATPEAVSDGASDGASADTSPAVPPAPAEAIARTREPPEPPAPVPAPSPAKSRITESPPEEARALETRTEDAVKRIEPRPTGDGSPWPWIATITGSAAAIGAGICALAARDRYNALSDRSQSYESARTIKTEGERWQLASYVFSGLAVAGLTTGILGFTGTSEPAIRAAVVPVPGGGTFTLAGDLP